MTPETKAEDIMVSFIVGTIGMPTLSNKQAQACAILHCQGIIDALEPLEKYWRNDVINPIKTYEDILDEISKL